MVKLLPGSYSVPGIAEWLPRIAYYYCVGTIVGLFYGGTNETPTTPNIWATRKSLPRSEIMAMRKLVAITVAFLMISAPALVFAGSKGFSGSRGSSAFKSRPAPGSSAVKPGDSGQSQTGSIRDLGVNPSTKSPADMVKNRPETPAGMAPGAGPVPQSAAPGFFGSGGGFGSSLMTWGFLGYLFGRSHSTTPQRTVEKELELIPDPVESR